jgi:hypothetical protein
MTPLAAFPGAPYGFDGSNPSPQNGRSAFCRLRPSPGTTRL